ncbi:MAG: tryptophan synthase subunit alpha [Streptococcaceae bacterium]|jgi:tryptophan synthase alpha chain|nr:tryptophan synthase subunit alpha [Streptococcaceae bacterium]
MKTLEKQLRDAKKIMIPYIMAGDHENGLDGLQETISLLENAGATAIEIGVPFSDPVADGPVIEQAGIRALQKGVTLTKLIVTLKNVKTALPLILMGYANPIYQYGLEKFVADAVETPVKGLIVPDVPKENQDFIAPFLEGSDIALIQLVSLTTHEDRQKMLVDGAEGFIYAVAINGVTGVGASYSDELDGHVARLAKLTDLPVCVGFGVSSQADVDRFYKVASGVIVGSKIVRDLHDGKSDEVASFVAEAVK